MISIPIFPVFLDAVDTDIAALKSGKAATNHTHTEYAPITHEHSGYASATHEHAGYASVDHTHSNYSAVGHTHTEFAPVSHSHELSAITGLLDLLLTDSTGNVKTTLTGDVLSKIKALSVGMYTAYSMGGSSSGNTNVPNATESWRYLIHKTGAIFGWVLAFGTSGSIYTNYLDNGTWRGWKALWDANPDPLWAPSNGTSGYYMTAGHTVTPTKKLSECRNGWILVWSDYNSDATTTQDYDFTCSVIPKIHPNGGAWAGHSWLFDLPLGMQSSSPYTTKTRKNEMAVRIR